MITISNSRFSVKLFYDESPDNPRHNDKYSQMVCWNEKYNLGDKHTYGNEKELLKKLMQESNINPDELGIDMNNFEAAKPKILEQLRKHIPIVPMFLYDGETPDITCAAERFGKNGEFIGYAFMEEQDLEKAYGEKGVEAIKQGLMDALGELDLYSHYVRGNNFLMNLYKDDELFCSIKGFTGNMNREMLDCVKKATKDTLSDEKVTSEQVNDMFGVDSPQIVSDKSYDNAPQIANFDVEEEL